MLNADTVAVFKFRSAHQSLFRWRPGCRWPFLQDSARSKSRTLFGGMMLSFLEGVEDLVVFDPDLFARVLRPKIRSRIRLGGHTDGTSPDSIKSFIIFGSDLFVRLF
jgi:hypothetical protein